MSHLFLNHEIGLQVINIYFMNENRNNLTLLPNLSTLLPNHSARGNKSNGAY